MNNINILKIDTNGIRDDRQVISEKLKARYDLILPADISVIYSESENFSNTFNQLKVYMFNIDSKEYILKVFSQSSQNKNIYLMNDNKSKDSLLVSIVEMYKNTKDIEIRNHTFKTYNAKTLYRTKTFSKMNILKNIRVGFNSKKSIATNTINVSNLLLVKEDSINKLYLINFEIKAKV
jgi:hypothetical protein